MSEYICNVDYVSDFDMGFHGELTGERITRCRDCGRASLRVNKTQVLPVSFEDYQCPICGRVNAWDYCAWAEPMDES